jgi:hypothetical protein
MAYNLLTLTQEVIKMKALSPEMVGRKVFVYWNLHKNVWSIRDEKSKKVIAHSESLLLTDCKFKVSEAGRQRVLRERKKNVHAGATGILSGIIPRASGKQVYYNPYKQDCFTVDGYRIDYADTVRFYPDRLVTL